MMGEKAPETCWVTYKRQVINLWNCCILLVNLFQSLLSKFGSKALLKMLRTLNLSQRRRTWRFWSWLRGLDWLKLASRCLRTSDARSGERHQLDKELLQIRIYDAEEIFELLTYLEHNLTLLSKFGSKAPLKMLRTLNLSQRRGPWRFWSWLRDLD